VLKFAFAIAVGIAPTTKHAIELPLALMALNSFTTLPAQFSSARVLDEDGVVLGNVHSVERGTDGIPAKIRIGIAGNREIILRSIEVRYDQGGNVVVAHNHELADMLFTAGEHQSGYE
jgi:hypothetical protein